MLCCLQTQRLIINRSLKTQVNLCSTLLVPHPALPFPIPHLLPTVSQTSRTFAKMALNERLQTFKRSSLRKAGLNSDECKLDPSILWPPESVRGMQNLDVVAFKKTVVVPVAQVAVANVGPVLRVLKNYYLKLRSFSALVEDDAGKIVYLNPLSFAEHGDKIKCEVDDVCKRHNVESSEVVKFYNRSLELKYENWDANQTLRAILPLDDDGVSGFSKVGHIIHLNLKEHLNPYKKIIGQVFLDKSLDHVTMVVNKVDTIDNSDNTFRSFSMEVLAGEGETIATLKQNRCNFTFDFAKVYWNPRLSTEHESIIKMLEQGDVLFDVMAGVGPFSVPAAVQKKCSVLANDLNPESYYWLQYNCKTNRVDEAVSCHNLDANQFIKTVLKEDLLKRWKDPHFEGKMHVTMNLPSIAVEFLPSFVGLMSDIDNSNGPLTVVEPVVHVYMFSKDQKVSSCLTRVAYYLGLVDTLPDFDREVVATLEALHKSKAADGDATIETPDIDLKQLNKKKLIEDTVETPGLVVREVKLVRRVAPMKVMVRVSFCLTKSLMFSSKENQANVAESISAPDQESTLQQSKNAGDEICQHSCKRIKLDDPAD